MKKISSVLIASLTLPIILTGSAFSLPIGFSAFGGLGTGYYAMSHLNSHIGNIGQDLGVPIEGISSGINITLQGRIWFINRIAITGGYERLWADTEAESAEITLSYKAPCNLYFIGAAGTIISLPEVLDFNVGVNYTFASATFGTNLDFGRRLREFKGSDNGYEIFAEVTTNFIRPVEVGFQMGYRGLKIDGLVDKYGDSPDDYYDYMDYQFKLDYSGVFFYITVGIRL